MDWPAPEAYERAARALGRWLRACVLCPRGCRVNRAGGELGYCRAGVTAPVNTVQPHHGEEPPISGGRGSGTIFFSGCTLGCVFCQNHAISQGDAWRREMTAPQLAGAMLDLEAAGAHNINLVTPTPHLPVILAALAQARRRGLDIPIVYNTSGYERAAALRRLEGLIDIYMPDFKYIDEAVGQRLSDAPNYVASARAALREMHRQVGNLKVDDDGVAYMGVLVRHLVLPNGLSGSPRVLAELAEICGPRVWVSLMSQYTPMHRARTCEEVNRRVSKAEYMEAVEALYAAGIHRGWIQGLGSATEDWVPDFKQ